MQKTILAAAVLLAGAAMISPASANLILYDNPLRPNDVNTDCVRESDYHKLGLV